jgi:WhiB family redox-sensing transcriptional regulator
MMELKSLPEMEFREEANCKDVDPNVFFPGRGESHEQAQSICQACPAREACLEYAIGNKIEHGIWGGASERERRRIVKNRRELAAVAISA